MKPANDQTLLVLDNEEGNQIVGQLDVDFGLLDRPSFVYVMNQELQVAVWNASRSAQCGWKQQQSFNRLGFEEDIVFAGGLIPGHGQKSSSLFGDIQTVHDHYDDVSASLLEILLSCLL